MGTILTYVVLPFGSVLLGGLIKLLISKHYYIKAAMDLNNQAAIFGNFLQQWKDGKDPSLWFNSPGSPPTGQSIAVPVDVIEGKFTTCDPAKPGRAE